MNCVDLRCIQGASEQLAQQIKTLKLLQEGLCQAEEKIKHMAYVEGTSQTFAQSREAIDDNIRVLAALVKALREAVVQYNKTEEKIADRYNLDVVIYPDTQFGISRITGMEAHRSLMPF